VRKKLGVALILALTAALVLGVGVYVAVVRPWVPRPPDSLNWAQEQRTVTIATPDGISDRDITYHRNSIGMEFVLLPAGEFMMGSREPAAEVARRAQESAHHAEQKRCGEDWFAHEHPRHEVWITKPLFVGAAEVTREHYKRVMGRLPRGSGRGPDAQPVDDVSWDDANAFCARLSEWEGKIYRLPTEAEWEYACRAGTTTPFYTGETLSTDAAYFEDTPKYHGRMVPAGMFPANPWGIYNMPGNAWEWCSDWYAPDYYAESPRDDPEGPDAGTYHVMRGGSSYLHMPFCRSAARSFGPLRTTLPTSPLKGISFRVVVESGDHSGAGDPGPDPTDGAPDAEDRR